MNYYLTLFLREECCFDRLTLFFSCLLFHFMIDVAFENVLFINQTKEPDMRYNRIYDLYYVVAQKEMFTYHLSVV